MGGIRNCFALDKVRMQRIVIRFILSCSLTGAICRGYGSFFAQNEV